MLETFNMASAGKKKGKVKGKTVNLNEFLGGGSEPTTAPGSSYVLSNKSWADASEDLDDNGSEWHDESYGKSMVNRAALPTAPRSAQPIEIDKSTLPDKPPYTVFVGNLPYDIEEEEIITFFRGCNVTQVRLPRDSEGSRFKGFGYAEIGDMDSLMAALKLNNENLRSRRIRVDIAGQQGDREDRSSSDWRGNRGGGYGGRGGEDERAGRSDGAWDRPTVNPNSYDDGPGSRDGYRDDRRYDNRGYNRDRGGYDRDRGYDDGPGSRGYNRGSYDRDRGYDDGYYRDRGYRNESAYGNGGDRFNRDRGYDGYGSRDQGYGRDRGYRNDRGYGDRYAGDRGYGDRSYGRDYGGDRGYSRDGGYDRDRRGHDDRGGGNRGYNSGYGDRDGGYNDAHSDEPPRERKKLILKPRTHPIDSAATNEKSEAKSQASIFGGAKPVDTASKERQIEEKLKREQESEKAEVEESRRNRQINRERPRRDSERSNEEGRTRHSSSSSTGKGPKPVMLRRESERSDDESKKEDQPLSPISPKSPTSPPPKKEDPTKVLVPAPAPKENVWARRSEGITSPRSESAPASTSSSANPSSSSSYRKDYKPSQGRGRDRDRNERNTSDRRGPPREHQQHRKHEKVKKPREIPKYEEKAAPDFTQKNKFAGLEQEDD